MWIPPWTGCGGWCVQVVIVRNGKTDCISQSAPSYHNCYRKGFSAGQWLTAYFNNDCTPLDKSLAESDDGSIKFRLHTPVGGSGSDWCVRSVDIEASNGTKTQTYVTPFPWTSDKGEDYWWVGQGDWNREHWAKNHNWPSWV